MDVVSSTKQIAKHDLILTYNNIRVFQLGTPATLGITDEATFCKQFLFFPPLIINDYNVTVIIRRQLIVLIISLFFLPKKKKKDIYTKDTYDFIKKQKEHLKYVQLGILEDLNNTVDAIDLDDSNNSSGINNNISLSSGSNCNSGDYDSILNDGSQDDCLHLKLLEESGTVTKLKVKKVNILSFVFIL